MSAARDYPFILARKTLMKGMQQGNDKAAIEYLKRRDKRYSEKVETRQTNIEANPLKDKLDEIDGS